MKSVAIQVRHSSTHLQVYDLVIGSPLTSNHIFQNVVPFEFWVYSGSVLCVAIQVRHRYPVTRIQFGHSYP